MKRLALPLLLSVASTICLSPVTRAAGFIIVDPQFRPVVPVRTTAMVSPHTPAVPPSPSRPLLKGNVAFGLHLKDENIRVEINDQVARTSISQTFMNDTDQTVAGTYLFPLPDDTTFSSFSLHIDGKPVEGKILEANEARQQYETIVRQMVDPGLLEYADYKTVRVRVFPIPAHGTKKVELEYTQVLRAENGLLRYSFPLKSNGASGPIDDLNINIKLASKQHIRTIWSPSYETKTKRDDDQHAKIALSSHDIIPDKDFLLYYSVNDKDMAANVLTHKLPGEDGYFLMTLSPPLKGAQVAAKDIVLVVDTSGSMQGSLKDAKSALKFIVNALSPADRFSIVQFNTDVDVFKSAVVPASPDNKKAALSFIDDLEARGGTNISGALNRGTTLLGSTGDRPAYMVLMTDGQPTVGDCDPAALVKAFAPKRDIRLFDFGLGYDVNTRLLNQLAEQHHGTSQYVEPDEDLERVLTGFYGKIENPVLSNVSLTYSGIDVKDVYPREVTDIFAGSQVLLIGKYKDSGKASIALSGKLNGASKSYSFPLEFSKDEPSNTYLPRLWAMRRIGHLTDVAHENGNSQEIVDEIVSLSKQYGIISAFTSFLVTDPSDNRPVARFASRAAHLAPAPSAVPHGFAVRPVVGRSASGGAAGSAYTFGDSASVDRLAAAQSDVDFGPYMADLQRRAKRSWSPPKGNESKDVTLDFKVSRTGAVSNVRVSHSSGIAIADQSAINAIENAAPFRALPPGSPDGVDIQFKFDYNVFHPSAGRPTFLPSSSMSGKDAIVKAKSSNDLKEQSVLAKNDEDSGIKTVEDKTFYMRDGVWIENAVDSTKLKPEVISFGSKRYFELLTAAPGISKYLAVGEQVMFIYDGHCYKIVSSSAS